MADFQDYKHSLDFDSKKNIHTIDFYKRPGSRNTMFFSDKIEGHNPTNWGKIESVKIHETMSDKQITRHYNNPFAAVKVEILERTIKSKGDKVIITNTRYQKERNVNGKYFRSSTIKTILTFDFKTGNFQTITTSHKGKGKGSKNFRTNNFYLLKEIIKESPGIFKLGKWQDHSNFKFRKELLSSLDNKKWVEVLSKLFNIDPFTLNKADGFVSFYEKIVENFIKLRKIKVPDHSFNHLFLYSYPKEKLLKKNDRKLFASVLDLYGIKCKYTIKLLHKYPYLDLGSLAKLCRLLGNEYPKYLASIPENIFAISQTQRDSYTTANYSVRQLLDFETQIAHFIITDIEKENLIKTLSDEKYNKPITYGLMGDIYDHFNMIDKIREYDGDLVMKAKTYTEFHTEHTEFSKMISAIKKGWVIEYVYDEKTIEQIESPHGDYYPYILKREEEYIEEGKFMHHCVASYADHYKSIIISIRTDNNQNRLTCEFDIQTGNLVQARHFCNREVPEEFKPTLEDLRDKVRLHARYGTLNWKETKKVPVKINGVEVKVTEPKRASDLTFGW